MSFGVTPTGFKLKRLEDIQSETEDRFKTEFGDSINLTPQGPMGQIKGIFDEELSLIWELSQDVWDSGSPETAEDIALDNVASLTGTNRLVATKSKVIGRIGGTPTTLVPAGFVGSVDGDDTARFESVADAIIGATGIDEIQTLTFSDAPDAGSFELVFGAETTVPILFSEADIDVENALNNLSGLSAVSVSGDFSTGFVITFAGADGETTHPALTISNNTLEITSSPITIDVEETVKGFPPFVDTLFQAEETGPTVANTGSLTAIETPQGGVTQLTNPQDAEIGSNIETDAELKQRRKELLQRSGTATVEGIRNALLDVVDVNQALVIENTALIVDAGGRPGKSFESVVEGGADQDIADAIWASKPAGIETFGSVSVPVVDSQGFIHTINFSRATEIDIWMIVNITPNTDPAEGPLYPIDGDQQVEDVVLAFAQDFRIGQDVVVSQFYTPINTIGGVIGIEILVGTSPAPTMSDNIAIDVTERAVFDSARITVNS